MDISGLYTLTALQQAIASDPSQWRPLVLTNGCFDLLHAGHVRYLRQARSLGRSLVVGLNSDRSVQRLKPALAGEPTRPIIPEQQRAELVAALRSVDAVILFDELTATHLITALQPNIYVKGGDYTLETLPEAAAIQACQCHLELIKFEVHTSTTAIIQRIRQGSSV